MSSCCCCPHLLTIGFSEESPSCTNGRQLHLQYRSWRLPTGSEGGGGIFDAANRTTVWIGISDRGLHWVKRLDKGLSAMEAAKGKSILHIEGSTTGEASPEKSLFD